MQALIDRLYLDSSTFPVSAGRDRGKEHSPTLMVSHLTSGTRFPKFAFLYLARLKIVFHTVLEAFSF